MRPLAEAFWWLAGLQSTTQSLPRGSRRLSYYYYRKRVLSVWGHDGRRDRTAVTLSSPRTLSNTAAFNVEPMSLQAMTTTVATVCSSPSASSTLTIRGAVMFLTVTPNRVDA